MTNKILIAIVAAVVSITIGGIFILVQSYGASQIQVGELRERTKNAQAIAQAQETARLQIIETRNEYDEIIKDIRKGKAGCVGPNIQRTIDRLPNPRGHE